MKIIKFLMSVAFIIFVSSSLALAKDCEKFDKLSSEYAKCTSDNLKNKTQKKAKELKKKFNSSKLKEKLLKFKNSKSHKEFFEK